jgi:hypothetical protein
MCLFVIETHLLECFEAIDCQRPVTLLICSIIFAVPFIVRITCEHRAEPPLRLSVIFEFGNVIAMVLTGGWWKTSPEIANSPNWRTRTRAWASIGWVDLFGCANHPA